MSNETASRSSAESSGPMREALLRTTASLAAAISLLERTPKAKKVAPSDKMFDQMLVDYRNSLEAARAALASQPEQPAGLAQSPASSELADKIERLSHEATAAPWQSRGMGGHSTLLAKTPPAHNRRVPIAYGHKPENGYSIGLPFSYEEPGMPGQITRGDFVEFSHRDAELIATLINAAPEIVSALRSASRIPAETEIALQQEIISRQAEITDLRSAKENHFNEVVRLTNELKEAKDEAIVLREARDLAVQNRNHWQEEAERRLALVESLAGSLRQVLKAAEDGDEMTAVSMAEAALSKLDSSTSRETDNG